MSILVQTNKTDLLTKLNKTTRETNFILLLLICSFSSRKTTTCGRSRDVNTEGETG